MNAPAESEQTKHAVRTTLRDAALVVVVSTVLALGINAIRSDGLPLVASKDFEILVPCPEPVGDPQELAAGDAQVRDARSLVLDVRGKEDYEAWHVEGARNQPFDWLGPPVDAEVAEVAKQVAASGAQRVVVYGDGDDPDSGREWAKLLSGARIKNVFFVQGGAPALNPALTKPPGLEAPGDPAEPGGAVAPPPPSGSNPAAPAREEQAEP